MELIPNQSDRLKKVATVALASIPEGAIVKYIWEKGTTRGYVYDLEASGVALIGLLGEGGEKPILQYGGKIIRRQGQETQFNPDEVSLTPDQIAEFERVFIDIPASEA